MRKVTPKPAAAEAGILSLLVELASPDPAGSPVVSPADVQTRLKALVGDARAAAFLLRHGDRLRAGQCRRWFGVQRWLGVHPGRQVHRGQMRRQRGRVR